ncbi:hypothetical protein CkaCkLH20_12593 [Colletotrichum karsti]|uniref:AB hydrolase-1 domain-containing protein n=1 Tax=Colletotrichum karsti TaxID=1095194 RepID=A0A9P6LCW7_9PEZI|nr:uncharacterized protein CkaCkLH20_12593 [Colletotrichum karsti]KAF9869984.1 hypothetical protein CkaCkLH20_12593 [Colletotrichum karsti]
MQPFKYSLPKNGTVTGAHCIPPSQVSPAEYRPLIVALHGGGYDHQYFDATPRNTASLTSTAYGVPFVSIDRPSYGGTSCVLPIPEGSKFPQETARLLHNYILPKLWTEIGLPNHCNSIVLLCHSLGVMSGIVTAGLHAQDAAPAYPLSGLIASGMGDKQSTFMKNTPPFFSLVDENHASMPIEAKDTVMFKPGTVTQEVLDQSKRLDSPMPIAESALFASEWLPVWKEKWAPLVKAPVMFSLVEDDPFFVATKEEVEVCVRAFSNSSRVDGSFLLGAPHCVELSHWSQGWYARCFGFALECAATLGVSQQLVQKE